MFPWSEMGQAGGASSSPVSMKTQIYLGPECPGTPGKQGLLSSIGHVLMLTVPKTFVLPKSNPPFSSGPVLIRSSAQGEGSGESGPPCVSSPFSPVFSVPAAEDSWTGVCQCLVGCSLEAKGTGTGWVRTSGGSAWVPGGMWREESWLWADLWAQTRACGHTMEGLGLVSTTWMPSVTCQAALRWGAATLASAVPTEQASGLDLSAVPLHELRTFLWAFSGLLLAHLIFLKKCLLYF